MNKKAKSSLGAKTWIVIWVAGLAGQLAWNIENQWFNTFVYGRIGAVPWIITAMVSISAKERLFPSCFQFRRVSCKSQLPMILLKKRMEPSTPPSLVKGTFSASSEQSGRFVSAPRSAQVPQLIYSGPPSGAGTAATALAVS